MPAPSPSPGGTGKLTGITGQSDLIVRTALSGTTIDQQGGGTVSAAKGLAIWPEMRFEIPGKSADLTGLLGAAPGGSTGLRKPPESKASKGPGSDAADDAPAAPGATPARP